MDKFVGTEKPKRYDSFAGIEFPTDFPEFGDNVSAKILSDKHLNPNHSAQIEDNTEHHKAKASIEEAKAYEPTKPSFTILDVEELDPIEQYEFIQLSYLQQSLDLLKRIHSEIKGNGKGYSDGQAKLYDTTLINMKKVIDSLLGK